MKNDFIIDALDDPVGICMQNGGMNECPKWPDIFPSPCCWLSCSELCGAACLQTNDRHGKRCSDFGGDRIECSDLGQHPEYGQKRVVGI